jgi:hypothetical protein
MADVSEEVPIKDATTAISQGKRHLLVRDYHLAVVVLAQACELLAQEHGETGDEMGELYLLYGRALLGLAREEAGVLGGGVPGSEEASQDEQGEEEEEEESEEGTAAESNSAAEDNSCIPNGKETEPITKKENEDSEDTKAKGKVEKKAEEKVAEKAEEKADGKAEADEKVEKPSKTIDNKVEKMNTEESKRIEEIPGCSRDFDLHNNEASSSKTKRQRKETEDEEADEEEEEEDVEGKENEEDDVNNLQV